MDRTENKIFGMDSLDSVGYGINTTARLLRLGIKSTVSSARN